MSGSNSDLINALSGGGVLGAIAHPAQINLLADYGSAANTADAIWRTRANQANDLRGQLLQQATDADGNVNMLKYNQLASKAGPTMALAMPAGLTQSTEIAGQQQAQALKNLTAQSTALDSLGPNATYQQVQDKLQEGLDGGWLQRAGAGAVLVGMPQGDDPKSQATRAHILQTIGDQVRSTTERLQSQYGVKSNQTGPAGQTIGLSTDQRTGVVSSAQPPGSGVPLGPSADTVFTARPAMVPDTRPGAAPGTYAPTPRTYPQSGASPAGAAPPIPGTGGYTPPKTAGYQPRAGAPTADAPAPPAGGAAPQPQTYLEAPQGQLATLENDQKIAFGASQTMNDQQKRTIAGETALQALKLARTGPGTGTEAQWAAFLEAHGITPPNQGGLSATDYRQLLKKNLLRFAQDSGKAAGTDLQLTEKLASNANVDEMTNPANEHVLVQDMGILRRDMAMTRTMPQPSGTGDVAKHIRDFPSDTDPRAFAIDLMPPAERAKLLAEAAKEPAGGKIHRSLEIAHGHGAIAVP